MRCAQERDRLTLLLRDATVAEKAQAYKDLERSLVKDTSNATDIREIRRRITEDLLVAMSDGPWALFAPYLRRIERLGYSSLDRRILVCAMVARAVGNSNAGRRKTARLINDLEQRAARSRRLHPKFREEIEVAIARARSVARLPPSRERGRS